MIASAGFDDVRTSRISTGQMGNGVGLFTNRSEQTARARTTEIPRTHHDEGMGSSAKQASWSIKSAKLDDSQRMEEQKQHPLETV